MRENDGGFWEKNRGVWEKNGGVWEKSGGVCRALHVVRRRLQGVLRRRTAVEDVARLAEAVGGGGGGGGAAGGWGRAGWLGGERGACQSHGNVEIMSEKFQTFRSKDRAQRDCWERLEGFGQELGGSGQRLHFVGKENAS